VYVCPTGVDIRDGASLGCIQCGLCIDACDAVMAKIGRPARLISYDTEINIQRRRAGKAPFVKVVRARTSLYAAIIVVVGAVMLYTLATRQAEAVKVVHDRNPVFVRLSDGAVRNAYTVHVLNKSLETRRFILAVSGLADAFIEVAGDTGPHTGHPTVEVGPDQAREFRVLVTTYETLPASVPLIFRMIDTATQRQATAADFFRGP
jgi:polyferredoxin